MYIERSDNNSVVIALSDSEAEHLLSAYAGELDFSKAALALRDGMMHAGVLPLAKPDHIRTEHVPPSDLMNPHSETGD